MGKESLGKHGGNKLYTSNGPLVDVLNVMDHRGRFITHRIEENFSLEDKAFEENKKMEYEQMICEAQSVYSLIRSRTRDALRSIIGFIFQKYDLPRDRGLDIGSGAYGEMVENILSPLIDRESWTQIDINSECLESRNLHPSSSIQRASYLNLSNDLSGKNYNIVTGLSALDNTVHLEDAISEIRGMLVKGGFLLHVQDLLPAPEVAQKELIHMGVPLPHHIRISRNGEVVYFHVPNQGFISSQELFQRQIGRIIQDTPGINLVLNSCVTAVSGYKILSRPWRSASGAQISRSLPFIPGRDYTSAVVTLAKIA